MQPWSFAILVPITPSQAFIPDPSTPSPAEPLENHRHLQRMGQFLRPLPRLAPGLRYQSKRIRPLLS